MATVGTGTVVLDLDASIPEIHSENKEGTAPHFKHGFGFHPMIYFADQTGEMLAAMLRPGNSGANKAADHPTILDDSIAQLPAHIALGHRPGHDPALVELPVMVSTDSAGGTRAFINGCAERNIGFEVVARQNSNIHGAIGRLPVLDARMRAHRRVNNPTDTKSDRRRSDSGFNHPARGTPAKLNPCN